MNPLQTFRAEWQGIGLTITWRDGLMDGELAIGQMEVTSDNRVPLPVSETGYKAGVAPCADVEEMGGPVPFALDWLDYAAESRAWKAYLERTRQLSLF